jgi:hypothetical protein
VVLKGDNFDEASQHCQALIKEHGYAETYLAVSRSHARSLGTGIRTLHRLMT